MRRAWSLGAVALTLSQLFLVMPTHAAVFPDVPDGHLFQTAVEALVTLKVVNGNPDGTFLPDKSVNRAELLAMLYRAAKKTPDATKKNCFPDVQPGSWYELYVCDAAANKYVQGYNDGTFKPNKEVNKVEALKMIMMVLDIPVPELSGMDKNVIKFVDVSASAWYTKYLYNAFNIRILPIPGMSSSYFMPDAALKRGEVAAYIYNAIGVNTGTLSPLAQSESSAATSSASITVTTTVTTGRSSATTAKSSVVPVKPKHVPATFDDAGTFDGKKTVVYEFTTDKTMVLNIHAGLTSQYLNYTMTCRLYRIDSTGFANEYYLGYQDQSSCNLLTKITAGNYQLELQPSVAGVSYTVTSKEGTGDGNDGFSEAKTLLATSPRSDFLDVADNADWFKFKLDVEKNMMVETTNDALTCLIYPMSDVDIYGFAGPVCNQEYLFPVGTYYVGVVRKMNHPGKESYTVRMK